MCQTGMDPAAGLLPSPSVGRQAQTDPLQSLGAEGCWYPRRSSPWQEVTCGRAQRAEGKLSSRWEMLDLASE